MFANEEDFLSVRRKLRPPILGIGWRIGQPAHDRTFQRRQENRSRAERDGFAIGGPVDFASLRIQAVCVQLAFVAASGRRQYESSRCRPHLLLCLSLPLCAPVRWHYVNCKLFAVIPRESD